MKSLRRMRNLIEDAKNATARRRKQQLDLPTSNELIANPRYDIHQPAYEMERRWQASMGGELNNLSTFESLRQEIDNLERELRAATVEAQR